MANYAIVGENKKKWSLKSFSSTCSRVNERDDLGYFFFIRNQSLFDVGEGKDHMDFTGSGG